MSHINEESTIIFNQLMRCANFSVAEEKTLRTIVADKPDLISSTFLNLPFSSACTAVNLAALCLSEAEKVGVLIDMSIRNLLYEAIEIAISNYRLEHFRVLIDRYPSYFLHGYSDGVQFLNKIAFHGGLELAKYLVEEKGVEYEKEMEDGGVIFLAKKYESMDVYEYLKEHAKA